MLWKAQTEGGRCPEVFTIKAANTSVVLCEHPAQHVLQAALRCWRTARGTGITRLEIKVEMQGLTLVHFSSHEIRQ